MYQIILPEVKPALEWVNGGVLQKVSPQRKHARAQRRFAAALGIWADDRDLGEVGTEWEFRLKPEGEIRRPLVPDVAYLAYTRLPDDDSATADIPHVAPDAVVEVLSPGDRSRDLEDKVRVYFSCGTQVVFMVNTRDETVSIRDDIGERIVRGDESISHHSLPGFTLRASTLFGRTRDRRRAVE
jgi:Uma2 family endonuclease